MKIPNLQSSTGFPPLPAGHELAGVTPHEYTYMELKWIERGGSATQGIGHLVVYGITGSQNEVDACIIKYML